MIPIPILITSSDEFLKMFDTEKYLKIQRKRKLEKLLNLKKLKNEYK